MSLPKRKGHTIKEIAIKKICSFSEKRTCEKQQHAKNKHIAKYN